MKTAVDILRDAKALISDPEKWVKGHYGDCETGEFCSFGAMDQAERGSAGAWLLADLTLDRAARAINPEFKDYIAFNDHPDTTHADVMALFDRAIELVSEQ